MLEKSVDLLGLLPNELVLLILAEISALRDLASFGRSCRRLLELCSQQHWERVFESALPQEQFDMMLWNMKSKNLRRIIRVTQLFHKSYYTILSKIQEPEVLSLFKSSELMQYLIENLNEHQNNVEMLKSLFPVVQILSRDEDIALELAAKGAAHAIANGMTLHELNDEVQESGCSAIDNLASNDVNEEIVGNLNMIELILLAIKNHERQTLRENATRALVNLSCSVENGERMLKGGCIDVVIEQMKLFPDSSLIAEAGCSLLWNLSHNGDVHISAIVKTEGVSAISNAIRKHPDNIEVQEMGWSALAHLATVEEGRSRVLGEKIIPLNIEALKKHMDDESVCESCMYAMRIFIQQEMVELPGKPLEEISRLASIVLEKHPANPRILVDAPILLYTISNYQ